MISLWMLVSRHLQELNEPEGVHVILMNFKGIEVILFIDLNPCKVSDFCECVSLNVQTFDKITFTWLYTLPYASS